MASEEAKPSSASPLLVLLISFAGATALLFGYRLWKGPPPQEPVPEAAQEPAPSAPEPDPLARPRGRIVDSVPSFGRFSQDPSAKAARAPGVSPAAALLEERALGLTEAVRANEGLYANLARRYTRKYPVIRQYGRDWMSYPDLKRCNDDYMRDHDPVKFAFRVASSPNFAALIRRYAGRPEILAFARDAVKTAPAGLSAAVQDYLRQDGHASSLLQRFVSAVGLPSVFAQVLSGKPLDQGKLASELLRSEPSLREMLRRQSTPPSSPR